MNTVVHIAPQLPPAVDGVGDYCWNLWKHWPEPRPLMKFLALHGADAAQVFWREAEVRGFSPNAHDLHEALERTSADTVVLHYVGYGYQPRGIPLWLPESLERWRKEQTAGHSSRLLVTMFHEMYASSSPLRSPFWVKPWARQIIARLVRASDLWLTSCDHYFHWLVREFGAEIRRGSRAPVGSNVPAAPGATEDRLWPFAFGRKLRVVIFGLPNTRVWTLERHWRLLRALVDLHLVEHISLIGKSNNTSGYLAGVRKFQKRIGGIWHDALDLSPERVAAELADGHIGFVANDAGTITKSGVFAALANNGIVVIASSRDNYNLRRPFTECVLLNDDQPRTITSIIGELRGNNRMSARRRATLDAAQAELSWTRIAAMWSTWLSAQQTRSAAVHAARTDAASEKSRRFAPAPVQKGGVRA